jgi:hypothetical protein
MPPATGTIMASLRPHKAGVGSAVNSLVRELGGAFVVLLSALVTYLTMPSRTVAPAAEPVRAGSTSGSAA